MRALAWLFFLAWAPVSLFSCTKKDGEGGASEPDAPSVARGKRVYLTTCVACHHSDPSKQGAIGPEVRGASLELLREKIMTGRYPEGHPNPKRKTQTMGAFPHLEADIPSLHLFLNEGIDASR